MSAAGFQTSELLDAAGFVAGTAAMVRPINALVSEIARTDIPILLVGESGSGKDAYARAIHRLSGRAGNSFRKVNCASRDAGKLIGALLEELRSGAETNSDPDASATVFLDGVHELDATVQLGLLSLLPDGESDRATDRRKPRIISSTTRNLERETASGRFLREVYFRLSGMVLTLPALRDRKEDLPAFLEHFIRKYANEMGKSAPEMNGETREVLHTYVWPGNIRELENVVRKMVAVGDAGLALRDLSAHAEPATGKHDHPGVTPLKEASRAASRQAERELIQRALERTHWNRKRAAKELQISYKSLLYKIKLAGLGGKEV